MQGRRRREIAWCFSVGFRCVFNFGVGHNTLFVRVSFCLLSEHTVGLIVYIESSSYTKEIRAQLFGIQKVSPHSFQECGAHLPSLELLDSKHVGCHQAPYLYDQSMRGMHPS